MKRAILDTPAGPDTVTLRRFVAPDEFPLPFTTYVPVDFQWRSRLEGRADAIAFYWDRGQPEDSALFYLVVLPSETDEDGAREIVRTVAERVRVPGTSRIEPIREHDWATGEYRIDSRGTLAGPLWGWVALGRGDGRWFYVVAQSKVEEWPRFRLRAEKILSEWRWTAPGAGPGS